MSLSGFSHHDATIETEVTISDGFLKLYKYDVHHQLFSGARSPMLQREAIVREPSIGVVLFDPMQEMIVLIEQFRMGPFLDGENPWILEIIAGLSESGEIIDEVAHREVFEESGYQVEQLLPIGNIYVSPGGTNERIAMYCGLIDITKQGNHDGQVFGLDEEGEDIKVHLFPLSEAYAMVTDGRIANAAAVIAIQWLQLNRATLHEDHQHP